MCIQYISFIFGPCDQSSLLCKHTLALQLAIPTYIFLITQLVAKAGLTLEATFAYKLTPEVSTEVCYTQSQVQVKNCIGLYDQWPNNKLELYAWYAYRGWCGWRVSGLSQHTCDLLYLLLPRFSHVLVVTLTKM